MIFDTSETHTVNELLTAIFPASQYAGDCVVLHDDQVLYYSSGLPAPRLDDAGASRYLSFFVARFNGKPLLPNFSSTRTVSICLNSIKAKKFRTPRHLYQDVCEKLSALGIPLPTALVASVNDFHLLWIVDDEFVGADLGELFQIEHGLTVALSNIAVMNKLGSATRAIEIPPQSGSETKPFAVLSGGALKTVSRSRLREKTGHYLDFPTAETLQRNADALFEVSDLLFHRSIDVAQYRDRYWIWIALYVGTCSSFTTASERSQIIRSAAESLENEQWSAIRNSPMRFVQDSYSGYEASLLRFLQDDQIRIAAIYPVNSPEWLFEAAIGLGISATEVTRSQLKYLRPKGVTAKPLFRSVARNARPLGIISFVEPNDLFSSSVDKPRKALKSS